MELDDDTVLNAIRRHVGNSPFTAEDLVSGTPETLTFNAAVWSCGPAEGLGIVQNSIARLEANGYVERRGTNGRGITNAGHDHLREVEKGEPNRLGRF